MDHLTSLEIQQEEYARISEKDLSVMKSHCKLLSNKLKEKSGDIEKSMILHQDNTSTEELQNTMKQLTLMERDLNIGIQNQRKVVDKRKKDLTNLSRDKLELQHSRKQHKDFNSILNNYEKHLQILIILKKVLNNVRTFAVCFKNYDRMPVEITINTTDNAVISVDLSHLKKSEHREELENWLNINKRIIPFIIKLRKCIIQSNC